MNKIENVSIKILLQLDEFIVFIAPSITACSLPSTSIFIKFGFGIKRFFTKKSKLNDNVDLFF